MSDAIHPFSLVDNSPNDAEKVAEGLETKAKAIEQLAGERDISDHKDVMRKFRNQIQPLAVSVSFWWCWVSETLQGLAVDKDLEDWLTTTLYDLTNTYFEGQCAQNLKACPELVEVAQFGRSKEKRSDCPLVTLGLVLDGNGF